MRLARKFEYPEDKRDTLRRLIRLEWMTVSYLASVVIVMYFVIGSSQAMKTTWVEDILSLVPSVAFLISNKISSKHPKPLFPYGYNRSSTIAFLCGSVALLSMGCFLLVESIMKLVQAEHPTIGSVNLFGNLIWLGWLMIPALLWSSVPAFFLGRAKLKPAKEVHNKTIYSDATMNKDDWLTACAAMVGVVGIGFGFWWLDSTAATLISLNVIYDGFTHFKASIFDLMDKVPRHLQNDEVDPVDQKAKEALQKLPWVKEAEIRLREEGPAYFCEAFIVPEEDKDFLRHIEIATQVLYDVDWKMHDITVTLIKEINHPTPVQSR